jgi:hypothetical protein
MKCYRWVLPWLLIAPLWGQGQTPGQNQEPEQDLTTPAQGLASPDQTPAQTQDQGQNKEQSDSPKQNSGTSKDRLFYTLPNFLTLENAGQVPPLSTAEKLKVTARTSFDPVEYLWIGALAGIGQAENSEPSFGQGAAGYAKRYGMQFADGTIENFMSKAIFPSLLHQDPRYFQSGKGSFLHRVGYAAGRIVLTRSDSGQTQFNYSEVFGAAVAAGISTYTYHPRDERDVRNAVDVWATQMGLDALGYVMVEFWPDIRRKLHKSKSEQSP